MSILNNDLVDNGIVVRDNESLKKAIVNIGQTIIDRADDIFFDTNWARKLTITAEITPDDLPTIEWSVEAFVMPKTFYGERRESDEID